MNHKSKSGLCSCDRGETLSKLELLSFAIFPMLSLISSIQSEIDRLSVSQVSEWISNELSA